MPKSKRRPDAKQMSSQGLVAEATGKAEGGQVDEGTQS